MTRSSISIIIATHNRAHALREVLDRLLMLFDGESVEILVFDDASTDGTNKLCTEYGNRISYTLSPVNVGQMEGRTRMIAKAQGEYLVSLDDDSSLVDPDALERIRESFAQYPNCAILAANIATPATLSGQLHVRHPPLPVGNFVACGAVLRSSCVREVGAYPAFLWGYGAEESYLSLRILDAGYDIVLAPDLRVFHVLDQTQRPTPARRGMALANELAILANAYPLDLALLAMARKAWSYSTFSCRRGTLRAMARAALSSLPRTVPAAMKSRRPVRRNTLRKFFELRKSLQSEEAQWHSQANGTHAWSDINGFFATSSRLAAEIANGKGAESGSLELRSPTNQQ